MSYRATNWAYELDIKSPAKPVLVALADMADEASTCFPGQDRLAYMTGLSPRTVRRALDDLEAAGLITRTRRHDTRGVRSSDRYRLSVEDLPASVTTGQSDHRSHKPRLPAKSARPTGQGDQGTIREPSGNHQQRDQSANVTARHEHEPNARKALVRIKRERALPIGIDEMLQHAYRLGDGDPWIGFRIIDQITQTAIAGANNPTAVLRKRLRDAA